MMRALEDGNVVVLFDQLMYNVWADEASAADD